MDGFNGKNTLNGMYFKNIGEIHSIYGLSRIELDPPDDGHSVAGVDIVHSIENTIQNCVFQNIENTEKWSGNIHALYIASGSSNNQISNCTFMDVNGDAIRISNESNYNTIDNCTFIRGGKRGSVTDWYSLTSTPKGNESTGNVLKNSRMGIGYYDPKFGYNTKITLKDIIIFHPNTANDDTPNPVRLKEENNVKINLSNLRPTITVDPESAAECQDKSVTITITDAGESGINRNNEYHYQLAESNTTVPTGPWSTYTDRIPFTIGTELSGTYYLWIKSIMDDSGNMNAEDVLGYTVLGPYIFDNPPKVTITTDKNAYKQGDTAVITATFNKDVQEGTPKIALNGVGTVAATAMEKESTRVYTYSYIVPAGNGTETITISEAQDMEGKVMSTDSTNTFIIDNTKPTIGISPDSSSTGEETGVTIIVEETGSGLDSNNLYQYQLGTSSTVAPTGTWNAYKSGITFTIGIGLKGDYYLWVRTISDNAGNESVETPVGYTVSNKFTFNNTAVTSVALNKSTALLVTGATQTLTATINPSNATNKNVTWSSSNTNVATVSSSGVITAVAVGTTTITVTTIDGSKTATCKVTVSLDANSLLSTLDVEPGTLMPAHSRWQTDYTVTVPNSVTSIEVYATTESSKATFVEDYEPRIVPLIVGSNSIEIKVKAEDGTIRTYTITVKRQSAMEVTITTDKNAYKQGDIAVITATFNKDVQEGTPKIALSGVGTVAATEMEKESTRVYTYSYIVPTGNGTETITISEAQDMEENVMVPDSTKTFIIDNIKPKCVITADRPDLTNAGSITYTFTFSEVVTGFDASKITVTNGDKGTFTTVDETIYTLVVTTAENQSDTQTVSIAAGVCEDTVGNGNESTSKSVVIDKTAPTITISPNGASKAKDTSVTITVEDIGGSGLSSSNSYEYQLGTNNTTLPTGTWNTYTSGTAFIIGSGLTGDYYLWIKTVSDNAGNKSEENIEGYTVSNKFTFDDASDEFDVVRYIVEDEVIYKISNETTVEMFKQNITTSKDIKILNKNGVQLEDNEIVGTGMKLLLGNEIEYELIVAGDTTGNGLFTITDLSRMISHRIGEYVLEGPYLKALDVNFDGKVTITDLSIMIQARVDNRKF